jgi:hypothetical protein
MVSDNVDFSGSNTAYFYPDCRTAILGTYGQQGQLVEGLVTEIIGLDMDACMNMTPIFMAPDPKVLDRADKKETKYV